MEHGIFMDLVKIHAKWMYYCLWVVIDEGVFSIVLFLTHNNYVLECNIESNINSFCKEKIYSRA